MVRRDLIARSARTRKAIEKVLATSQRGMTLSEIAEATGLPLTTVKRHLEKLMSIGRVYAEYHRGSTVYYWNGEGEYSERVKLSDNHVLFLDIMINPWGKPFIRVKESKRNPVTGEFEDVGAVLIDEAKVDEFIGKLKKLSERLSQYM